METTRTKTTSVFDIGAIRPEFMNFLNDNKRQYSLHLTMIDANTKENVLDKAVGKRIACFWCRHRFDWVAIGCPIRYVPGQICKTLQSPVTNETYTIKENVSDADVHRSGQQVNSESYYETDGIFCSFSCCLAYINDNMHNTLYSQSKTLLMNMYYRVNSAHLDKIVEGTLKAAPSWRLLKEYGGYMTIDEFRQSFTKTDFTETHVVKNIPRIKPVGVLFESKKQL